MKNNSIIQSFRVAFNGLKYALTSQRNLKIQGILALIAIILGITLKITRMEWAIVLTCIGLVMGLELMNTALEILLDKIHPEHDDAIGRAKDVAAAAVLLTSICSALAGIYVFYVRISALFD